MIDVKERILTACQRICLDCKYVGNITHDVAVHSCKEHTARLDTFLKTIGLDRTLLPVKVSYSFLVISLITTLEGNCPTLEIKNIKILIFLPIIDALSGVLIT